MNRCLSLVHLITVIGMGRLCWVLRIRVDSGGPSASLPWGSHSSSPTMADYDRSMVVAVDTRNKYELHSWLQFPLPVLDVTSSAPTGRFTHDRILGDIVISRQLGLALSNLFRISQSSTAF